MKKTDQMSEAVLYKLQEIDSEKVKDSEAIIDEINDNYDKDKLGGRPCMWNKAKTVWTQPPVPIYHGDLVNIEYDGYQSITGRYIGKGYGIAELYRYDISVTYHIGKVTGRGIDMNPRLISDEDLMYFIKD